MLCKKSYGVCFFEDGIYRKNIHRMKFIRKAFLLQMEIKDKLLLKKNHSVCFVDDIINHKNVYRMKVTKSAFLLKGEIKMNYYGSKVIGYASLMMQ